MALDSISGGGRAENNMFPEVDSTWKTFNEVQKLLSKTNGQVVGDVMTPAPVVVRETTNLEDAARLQGSKGTCLQSVEEIENLNSDHEISPWNILRRSYGSNIFKLVVAKHYGKKIQRMDDSAHV